MGELENLYSSYGQLMLQAEIINNRIVEIKKKIIELNNRPQPKREEKPKEEK